jgi:hypothetical protein
MVYCHEQLEKMQVRDRVQYNLPLRRQLAGFR